MYEAAIENNEIYFDHWLFTMKKNGLSMITIKNKIEKLDLEQYSVLHYAIRYNHHNLIRKLIEEFHCDVNLIGYDGETPLHTAARYQISQIDESSSLNQNIIQYLVSHHANLIKQDNHGRTALHYATMRNNYHNAKQLIQLGIPIDIVDGKNSTSLHFACRFHAIDCVRLFIEYGAIIDRQDISGNTPLHCLALSKQIIFNEQLNKDNIAYILLHAAKDSLHIYLEIENRDKKTALSLACEHGNENLVEILLRFNASINHYMPIHMAVKSGNIFIIQLLINSHVNLTLSNQHNQNSLHIACKYNRIDVLKILINYQMDLEIQDDQGYTPLLTATYFNHQHCMKILLIHGANITVMDKYRKNILHICMERNCSDVLKNCLQWIEEDLRRYNMFQQGDQHENTVLHAAARYGSFEICQYLISTMKHLFSLSNENHFLQQFIYLILKKNLNQRTPIHEAAKAGNFIILDFFFRIINPEDKTRIFCQDSDDELKTSLHLAASQGHTNIVQLLLEHGANVSSCDMNDSTPLHEAAKYNCYDCVEILLQYQASIDRYDGKYYTPLHRASQYGHWQIVRLLLNSNADIQRTNSDGYNSLEIAILNNHQSTVHEFLKHHTWKKSLRNAQIQSIVERKNTDKYEDLSTPLRKLIRYMPNEAEEVLTKCMIEIGGSEDYAYKIIFNYEFLEDQLSIFKWKQDYHSRSIDLFSNEINQSNHFSFRKKQTIEYSINTHVYSLRENHPLYMIITYHQYDLLKHPLIDRLIKRKWIQFSRTFFWILFLFYGCISFLFSLISSLLLKLLFIFLGFFLASFTFTILRVHHPQYYYSLFNASISTVSCETISLNLLRHESFILTRKNSFDTIIKWFLFSTIIIHIIKNLLLICIRLKMFFGLSNILELIALILSIIFSHDFYSWQMSIRFRCSFQWECGAFGILIAWITLIIYVQFLSTSGIYVVILEVILRKFLRFIPILIIFILGFGLAFHMLLQNQNVYNHAFDALIRTIVMLTGEFNYEEHIYHSESDNDRSYYQIIYFVYVLFCILMTILIMNLLIASAVGEIPPLLEHAHVKYSIICIKLIMNYEIFLSTFDWFVPYLKERVKILIENNQNEMIYPNRSKENYYQLKKYFHDRRKHYAEKMKEERMEEFFKNLSSK